MITANSWCSFGSKKERPFISWEALGERLGGSERDEWTILRSIVHYGLIPCFADDAGRWVLAQDVVDVWPLVCATADVSRSPRELTELALSVLHFEGKGCVVLPGERRLGPLLAAGLRSLLKSGALSEQGPERVEYFDGAYLVDVSPEAAAIARGQLARRDAVESSHASQFANSAYYMGSKKVLSPVITEAMAAILPSHGVVLDLMCGSGAAAGAFASQWRTLASDAQEFAVYLARVQGGGYDRMRAAGATTAILGKATQLLAKLREPYEELLVWEDGIVHGGGAQDLLDEYAHYLRRSEELQDLAKWRAEDGGLYSLFARYFGNVFFGLRQSVEIDALRGSIDSLESDADREWALGALIAAVSAVGTTYAGHFAQPVLSNSSQLMGESAMSETRLRRIIERRAMSVFHEFAVRFERLAAESERRPWPITPVAGPWEKALQAAKKVMESPVGVYLDAPYTREEYSRYYHVLETLVRYDYPGMHGKGRVPSKALGGRFKSEFFARDPARVSALLTRILAEITESGMPCVWSYASSGIASVTKVISDVVLQTGCSVRSLSIDYVHKAQGGGPGKRIAEYVFQLEPERGLATGG